MRRPQKHSLKLRRRQPHSGVEQGATLVEDGRAHPVTGAEGEAGDSDGFWLVRDVKGENGGIFLLKSSALAFARRVSRPSGCATVFSSETFELDVENQGNLLIGYLKPLVRLLASAWKGKASG